MSEVEISDRFDRYDDYEITKQPRRSESHSTFDSGSFLKGIILGFGLAAVASVFLNFFQEKREFRRSAMTPQSRLRRQDESGGILGDLSHVVDESSAAFTGAVKSLDKAFDSGRRAIETVQEVIDKIREQ
ncbi:MAG TPA: hypothetical protein ENN67_01815 [Firmicutes bacterium]|nr:hypothetical protein [Bacillota bacterium]